MTAFTNNSEMVIAVEGARGPPTGKKEDCLFSTAIIRYETKIKRTRHRKGKNYENQTIHHQLED